jgi:hypothetical protein
MEQENIEKFRKAIGSFYKAIRIQKRLEGSQGKVQAL